MQSLLLERVIGNVSPWEFATTLTESLYQNLNQTCGEQVFPANCHHNAAVNGLSLETNDYQYLLSGCADSSIKLWDLNDEKKVNSESDRYITSKVASIDDYDHPRTVFNNVATIERKSVHSFGVSCIQWWPFDTGMFVSASFDHTVIIWNTNELTPVYKFDIESRVYSIDTNGNEYNGNSLVAVGSDHPNIRLLDLRSASSAHTLDGHKGKTLVVKWHPQNPYLLASGGFDGEVKIWDIRRSKSCLCRLDMMRTNNQPHDDNLTKPSVKAHLGPVNGLVWNELGTILYSAGNDDKVRVWDMISSNCPPMNKLINFGPLTRNKYPQSIPIVLSSNYETEIQYLLFPSDNSDIYVFRTIDGKLISRLSRNGSKKIGRTASMIYSKPFSATYFCGTMDGEIISWSPKYEKENIDDYLILDSQITNLNEDKQQTLQDTRSKLLSNPFFNQK